MLALPAKLVLLLWAIALPLPPVEVASAVAVLAELGTPAAVPKVFAVALALAAPPRALLVAVAIELAKPPTPLLAPVPPVPPDAVALAVTAFTASSLVAVAVEVAVPPLPPLPPPVALPPLPPVEVALAEMTPVA